MGDARRLCERFLVALEERRLDEASACLAAGIRMTFPPARVFTSLDEMVEASRGRYRWAKKRFEDWDVLARPDGSTVVYSRGVLYGENLHGVPFDGIRYVDRFVVRNGLIAQQDVWNDLAESGVLTRTD